MEVGRSLHHHIESHQHLLPLAGLPWASGMLSAAAAEARAAQLRVMLLEAQVKAAEAEAAAAVAREASSAAAAVDCEASSAAAAAKTGATATAKTGAKASVMPKSMPVLPRVGVQRHPPALDDSDDSDRPPPPPYMSEFGWRGPPVDINGGFQISPYFVRPILKTTIYINSPLTIPIYEPLTQIIYFRPWISNKFQPQN